MGHKTGQRRAADGPPWPSRETLLSIGFVDCRGKDCRVMIDPVNLPGGRCLSCARKARQNRQRRAAASRERRSGIGRFPSIGEAA
jgi:hypothetical protein